jgi:hypothetical protein
MFKKIKFFMRKNMMKKLFLCFVVLCLGISGAEAAHKRPKKEYQQEWCMQHRGRTGVRLPDGTRCDCLTDAYAIAFEFGEMWMESIGQTLYYAVQTGKYAGVVLILEDPNDYKYVRRLNATIQYHRLNLKVWLIENYADASVEPSTRRPTSLETQKVCSGTQLAGWIKVDDEWNPAKCGSPTAIVYNVWTIARYETMPVGTVMSVCANAPTPPGWAKIDDEWSPTKCGHPSSSRVNNIKRIKRMQ